MAPKINKFVNFRTKMSELVWKPLTQAKWQARFTAAQVFVDSEVLRRCEPYIPLLEGILIKSGILGTKPGSGLVTWITPYARKRYYVPSKTKSNKGPLRGYMWFERMKAVDGKTIMSKAKRIAGRGEK
ncbi:MAG: minor capsid protein [Thermodesulfovibrionales bacterium]